MTDASGPLIDSTGDFARVLAAARKGESAAIGRLLEQHGAYLLAIAERNVDSGVRPKESPSDLLQETFLEAHQGLDQFRGTTEAEFREWLTNILRHNITDVDRRYRGTQKRSVSRELHINGDGLPGDDSSPSSPIRQAEEDAELERALARLPENYRLAIEYRHRDNLDFAALGDRLGVSADAARKLWARAIDRLRDELKRTNVT